MQRQQDASYREIELPEHILTHLKSNNGFKKFHADDTISVTELNSCKRKTFFKKTRRPQEEMITDNISDLWSSVRGNLLHKLTGIYSWNELEGSMDVEFDDDRKIKVCGRLDMYDHKTKTILELKTIDNVARLSMEERLPFSEHVQQVQAYYTIFSKLLPVEKLNLIYVDMNDMICFEIPIRDVSNWIKNRLVDIQNHVDSERIPDGEVSGNCRFCRYQTACFTKGGGIKENPQSVPKNSGRFVNSFK